MTDRQATPPIRQNTRDRQLLALRDHYEVELAACTHPEEQKHFQNLVDWVRGEISKQARDACEAET